MAADATEMPRGDHAPGWLSAFTISDGESLKNKVINGPISINQIAMVATIDNHDRTDLRISGRNSSRIPERSRYSSTYKDRSKDVVTSMDKGSSTRSLQLITDECIGRASCIMTQDRRIHQQRHTVNDRSTT